MIDVSVFLYKLDLLREYIYWGIDNTEYGCRIYRGKAETSINNNTLLSLIRNDSKKSIYLDIRTFEAWCRFKDECFTTGALRTIKLINRVRKTNAHRR